MWALTHLLKPGDKDGIPSGKPFNADETKALHLFTKWGQDGAGKIVSEKSIEAFSQECRAKSGAKPKDAKAAERTELSATLAARDAQDVLGRIHSLRSRTIDVTGAKVAYNLYQVAFNCIMVYVIFSEAWKYAGGDVMKLWGIRPDPSMAGNMLQMGIWLHYVNKFLEFVDTGFMAASGAWRQVSTLHVVHHAIMGPCWWHVLSSAVGASEGCTQGWFGSWINSCIHVMMYSYYFLSAVGVRMDWFRLPLTSMQLIQFFAAFGHACVMLHYRLQGEDWPLSYIAIGLEFGLTILMSIMFGDFFMKAYCAPKRKGKAKAA